MPAENLQTVIVPKAMATTRGAASAAAREHGRVYTSRETQQSWRFRQRPVTDFVKSSFRTKRLPSGISLVYGRLKRAAQVSNPGPTVRSDVRYMWTAENSIKRAKNAYELTQLAREIDARDYESATIKTHLTREVAARARSLRMPCAGKTRRDPTLGQDEKCFEAVLRSPTGPQVEIFESNPSARPRPLRNPRTMPDPGPSAWLGSLLEWKWKNGRESFMWDESGDDWLFLWSPRYKAIISIRKPKNAKKLSKVSRSGGGAKMFERFASRSAESTREIEIPEVKLIKLGKAEHIVYRSDKWSQKRKSTDYIHEFKSGVHLYCGPTLKSPEVFICFGGKLTCTERGLVN